jgi:hypothetical protein
MEIEDRFGIAITDAEAARCARVGDVLDCVMAKLETGRTSKPERQQWTRRQVLEEILIGCRSSAIGRQEQVAGCWSSDFGRQGHGA